MPDRNLTPLARALPLLATLGLGVPLIGCADIHPAPDDPGTGMLEAPTDEAVHDREASERETEHGDEEMEQHRR
jgi:hypothetical protein